MVPPEPAEYQCLQEDCPNKYPRLLLCESSTRFSTLPTLLSSYRLSIGSTVNSYKVTTNLPFISTKILPGSSLEHPKTTPPPLTSPHSALSQPSKQNSPLAINLEPVELIFSTPPTSPHPFFDSLEDLPPRTINPPPLQPSFNSIERLANQPPPLPEVMEPPLPLLPP
ncbi:hypothetical protein Tco_0238431 [Tanacetum coccineum]